MKHLSRILAAVLFAGSLSAQAAVVITIDQVGDDVVLKGSGSIDTRNGLRRSHSTNPPAGSAGVYRMRPLTAYIAAHSNELAVYQGMEGPETIGPGYIGPGRYTVANQYSGGNLVLDRTLIAFDGSAALPIPIDFSMTFENQTLETIGIDVGRYKWTWGTPEDGDSLTVCAGLPAPCVEEEPTAPTRATPVPTLGAFGLMGLAGVIGAAGAAMTRRRKQ
ncbi:IPTL-CTERM sorting domain-containing protein [Lampropedia aestuarii]|uniref:IPTL-CTERM sorting domain-containing protein n=1 Tax=Lampropedia aestuarii TaxID=2562762 RepID=UPI00246951CC|nr:IPTL-CTERM sorting domain-containing protein [Lampropedia aestuarii]MDH5857247.1 IPTL-CTERM sorting domain-containing protein [Lampropedia aestuarii]